MTALTSRSVAAHLVDHSMTAAANGERAVKVELPLRFDVAGLAALLTLGFLQLAASPAHAQTACNAKATDLIGARNVDVGDVNVCKGDTALTVVYETTYPYCLRGTALHAATDENAIPQGPRGRPRPLRFDHGASHACVGSFTYQIPLNAIGNGVSAGDTVVIAAGAVVSRGRLGRVAAWGEGERFVERRPLNLAMYFSYELPTPTAVYDFPTVQACAQQGLTCLNGLCVPAPEF